jgi:hypothetical protein
MVRGPVRLLVGDSLTGRTVRDIDEPPLKRMLMAWPRSGNQIGFEVF